MRCPLCFAETVDYQTAVTQEKKGAASLQLGVCSACGLQFAVDYAKDRMHVYADAEYPAWVSSSEQEHEGLQEIKRETFRAQLQLVSPLRDGAGHKLLDIGTGAGYLLEAAADLGFDCWGVEPGSVALTTEEKFPGKIFRGQLHQAIYPDNFFDVVCLTDVLEHISEPHELMQEIHRILKPDGILLLTTPNTGSITKRLAGKKWFQYKNEHVMYYAKRPLKALLEKEGFEIERLRSNEKKLSLDYICYYLRRYSLPGLGKIARFFETWLPARLKKIVWTNFLTGELLVIARKKDVAKNGKT